MSGFEWGDEDFQLAHKEMIEDCALYGVRFVGQGDKCVICGGGKPFLAPYYCEECEKDGNYEI